MTNLAFSLIGFLIPILFIAIGGLLLIAPEHFERIWYSRQWRISEPLPQRQQRAEAWAARLVGLVFVVAGVGFLVILIGGLVTSTRSSMSIQSPPAADGGAWHLLVAGLAMAIVGIVLMLRTEMIIHFIFGRILRRSVHVGAISWLKVKYRLYGLVCLLVGGYSLHNWLGRLS